MPITRPTGDQLAFDSSANGVQVLDTYLENAELGGRSIGDLLADLFDNTGVFRSSVFQFREDPNNIGHFQVRVGEFIQADTGWQTITFTNFAGYVADALQYKQDAEAAANNAINAQTAIQPVITNLQQVQLVATNISNVVNVGSQIGGTVQHAVTMSNNNFLIDGQANQSLVMKTGFTYEFDVSDPSNTENFAFSQTSDGTHNSGVEYTSNVTRTGTAGTAGAKVEIFINDSTPQTGLFYYGATTSGAGGSITVRDHNIDLLGAIASDITTAAQTVAPVVPQIQTLSLTANLTAIQNVNTDLQAIKNVDNDLTEINAVENIKGDITVLAQTNNLNAISNVNGAIGAITTLNSNINALTTLASTTNLAAIQQCASDISKIVTVANDLLESVSEIEAVGNSISNVDAVALKLSEINTLNQGTNLANIAAVAGDINNVNQVAGNLNAIINAGDDAEKYATHPVNAQFTDSQGNQEYSAKHYAAMAGAAGSAFTTIQGDERTTGDTSDVTSDSGSDTLQLFGLGGAKVRTDETNDAVYIDSRAVAMAIALG